MPWILIIVFHLNLQASDLAPGSQVRVQDRVYEVSGPLLGKGQYGKVYPVTDIASGEALALKVAYGIEGRLYFPLMLLLGTPELVKASPHLQGDFGFGYTSTGRFAIPKFVQIMPLYASDLDYILEDFLETENKTRVQDFHLLMAKLIQDIMPVFYDMAERGYFHMDLKPDNIGYRLGKFSLIDLDSVHRKGASSLLPHIPRISPDKGRGSRDYSWSVYNFYESLNHYLEDFYKNNAAENKILLEMIRANRDAATNGSIEDFRATAEILKTWANEELARVNQCRLLFLF